jgi:hypothetical protein
VKTNVYIDGFNLYNRAVKNTPYKWLDLSKLCWSLLPTHQINCIRYFTALVLPRPSDLQQPQRQQIYLRTLRTIPNLTIHYGQFRDRRVRRPLVTPVPGVQRYVEILDTEEKGSDVNLASLLLVDGYNKDYEQALVISNDSDLALPNRLVRENLNLPVGVVNPNVNPNQYTPIELSDAATFTRRLRTNTLRNSQFPPALRDAHGMITKPAGW